MLGDRHALAGDHALVEVRGAFDDRRVDCHALAGPDDHDITDANRLDRDLGVTVGPPDSGGLRREPDEPADRVGGMAPGSRLEVATQEDQGDDRRGRVEVQRQLAVPADPGITEEPGYDDGRQAVPEGRRGANRDESVHVGGPMTKGIERAAIERSGGVHLDRRR